MTPLGERRQWDCPVPEEEIFSASIFVDSGAHSIYNLEVLKHKKTVGRNGRPLAKPPVRWSQGDFSFYDLTKGSPFRRYCDSYAAFMKKMEGTGVILANVDAISNPALTWEIQRFFEEEHGVQPVPIIHYGTPMEWVDRYTEAKKYKLLGVGGLGQGVSRHEYFSWADGFFTHICPEENGRLPIIRTHGFAMTSWELMCRYPWWSVDSATWVKLSAYGWLYVPRSGRDGVFRYDKPPLMVNFSVRPPKEIAKEAERLLPPLERGVSPREKERQKHYKNVVPAVREQCDRWLAHLRLPMGSVDGKGEMKDFGVSSHHRARSIANLSYLKGLEQSRPKYPHALDHTVVTTPTVKYQRGFGV